MSRFVEWIIDSRLWYSSTLDSRGQSRLQTITLLLIISIRMFNFGGSARQTILWRHGVSSLLKCLHFRLQHSRLQHSRLQILALQTLALWHSSTLVLQSLVLQYCIIVLLQYSSILGFQSILYYSSILEYTLLSQNFLNILYYSSILQYTLLFQYSSFLESTVVLYYSGTLVFQYSGILESTLVLQYSSTLIFENSSTLVCYVHPQFRDNLYTISCKI